jgi:hypothetical protein
MLTRADTVSFSLQLSNSPKLVANMTTMEKSEAVHYEHNPASDFDDGSSTGEDVVGFETDLNHLPKGNFVLC